MAISISWIWQVKPGRMGDFLAKMREVRQAGQDDGLLAPTATHLWRVSIGGTATGIVFHLVDRESMADLAAVDEHPKPRTMAVFEAMTGPDGPADLLARNLQHILARDGEFGGDISWHAVGRAKPGRFKEYNDRLGELSERLLGAGALGVQHSRNAIGGPATGNLNLISEYADLASWAAAIEQLQQDEDWQQLVEEITGADGPITQDSLMLRSRIAL